MCMYNGEQYSSDTAKIYKKFDILTCDVEGKVIDGVKLDIQDTTPNSSFVTIAPIEEFNVNFDLDGRLITIESTFTGYHYIPLEVEPGKYKFINISAPLTVLTSCIMHDKGTIINSIVRENINTAIAFNLYSKDELEQISNIFPRLKRKTKPVSVNEITKDNSFNSFDDTQQEPQCEEPVFKTPDEIQALTPDNFEEVFPPAPKFELPDNVFPIEADTETTDDVEPIEVSDKTNSPKSYYEIFVQCYYKDYVTGKLKAAEIAERMGVGKQSIYNFMHKYKKENRDINY